MKDAMIGLEQKCTDFVHTSIYTLQCVPRSESFGFGFWTKEEMA